MKNYARYGLALLGETRVLSVDSALRLKYHPYPSRVRSPGENRALAAGSAGKGGALSKYYATYQA
ncbi:MAG: hypothetical protein A2158_05060 [Chloroflexi bacterium RBG_13_46_14]|nr:MAG: hypothetical protein A2158_05060 [Chloroflexi bacterium RBG_13_46_14]